MLVSLWPSDQNSFSSFQVCSSRENEYVQGTYHLFSSKCKKSSNNDARALDTCAVWTSDVQLPAFGPHWALLRAASAPGSPPVSVFQQYTIQTWQGGWKHVALLTHGDCRGAPGSGAEYTEYIFIWLVCVETRSFDYTVCLFRAHRTNVCLRGLGLHLNGLNSTKQRFPQAQIINPCIFDLEEEKERREGFRSHEGCVPRV